ncbi:hypothetical protein ACH40F_29270 [Streptomyces sp. NPDC020794]|uniref:hypothetical protein n=1 Tax=unclassified Streptomyces TaxID=2593676 RepID=UPI0036ED509A
MADAQYLAYQVKGMIARADAGLITRDQAKAEADRFMRHHPPAVKAEVAAILTSQLEGR